MHCRGSHSCGKASVALTSGEIHCAGENSCADINHMNGSNITCTSTTSCIYSDITIIDETNITSTSAGILECAADFSCALSTVSNAMEAIVYVGGAYAAYNSIITSPGKAIVNGYDLTIILDGYYSGYNLTIYCKPSDSCYIECYGNGCVNTMIDCPNDNCFGL